MQILLSVKSQNRKQKKGFCRFHLCLVLVKTHTYPQRVCKFGQSILKVGGNIERGQQSFVMKKKRWDGIRKRQLKWHSILPYSMRLVSLPCSLPTPLSYIFAFYICTLVYIISFCCTKLIILWSIRMCGSAFACVL